MTRVLDLGLGRVIEKLPASFREQFRFRPRHEGVAVHGDFIAAKRSRANDVLERFALAAAFDEFAQRVRFRRREHALEVQIQFHARQLEQMREQEFGLQSRRLDIFFAEKIRALLNRLKDGHAEILNWSRPIQKFFGREYFYHGRA